MTTVTPAFRLWTSIANIFTPASGALNGETWGSGNAADGSYPIWVDNYVTDAATATSDSTYTIVLTSEDWVDSVQPEVVVAAENLVNPFGPTGNLGGPMVFSSANGVGQGGVVYWAPSTNAGKYNLEYQTFTTNYVKAPSTAANTTVSGTPITLMSSVTTPTHWNDNWGTSDFVFSYTTTGLTASTEDIYFQAFTAQGAAESPLKEVATNISSSTAYYVGYASGSGYSYNYSAISGTNGASSGWYQESFDPTTGNLGAVKEVLSLAYYTTVSQLNSLTLSDGSHVRFVEGMYDGRHVLQVFKQPSSGAAALVTTVNLTSTAGCRWGTASVYDPADGKNDYTALIISDNSQVSLRLFDASGAMIGSPTAIPGLKSFDRIHSLSSSRVEIDYSYANPNGGTRVGAYIYDTSNWPYAYTLSDGGGEYIGTPGNDTITDGVGAYYVDGDGGADTFIVPAAMYAASGVDLTTNASGQIVVNAGSGNATTLSGFATIDIDLSATKTEVVTLSGAAGSQTLSLPSAGALVLGAPIASGDTLSLASGSEVELQTGLSLGARLAKWQSGDSVVFDALTYGSADKLTFVAGAGGVGGALELLTSPGAAAEILFHVNAGSLQAANFRLVADVNGVGSAIKFHS